MKSRSAFLSTPDFMNKAEKDGDKKSDYQQDPGRVPFSKREPYHVV